MLRNFKGTKGEWQELGWEGVKHRVLEEWTSAWNIQSGCRDQRFEGNEEEIGTIPRRNWSSIACLLSDNII